jgi:hypothetical protein
VTTQVARSAATGSAAGGIETATTIAELVGRFRF